MAVSQSGASAEVVHLAERLAALRPRPPLITVTNGLDNPLAQRADVALDTAAGVELCPSTKTFAASLVTLSALVDALAGHRAPAERSAEAELAAVAAERLLFDPGGLAGRMVAWSGGRQTLVVLGRGTARAAAEVGALILKESARRHAESLDTAEFRHGPLELSGPELAVAIVSTEPATARLDAGLAAELDGHGASVLLLAADAALATDLSSGTRSGTTNVAGRSAGSLAVGGPAVISVGELDPMLANAVAVIPLQLLAWRLALDGGRDPSRMTRASKVTTRE